MEIGVETFNIYNRGPPTILCLRVYSWMSVWMFVYACVCLCLKVFACMRVYAFVSVCAYLDIMCYGIVLS